jgi:hypothetical protein
MPGLILVGIPESRDFKLRSGITSLVGEAIDLFVNFNNGRVRAGD